jgi:hypothetical protein
MKLVSFAGNVATFEPFSGAKLTDGNYRITLVPAGIADLSGNALAAGRTLDTYVLGGDIDRDRTVGPGDFNILASHFGQSGQTWSTGDLDGDGTVGPGDFNILASAFGTTLIAPTGLDGGGTTGAVLTSTSPTSTSTTGKTTTSKPRAVPRTSSSSATTPAPPPTATTSKSKSGAKKSVGSALLNGD